jgi:GDPmannose 4,6-dehydratase
MVCAYRERYGMHASSGILYNHESPRRAPEFVTRKVTRAAAAISRGRQSELRLGNLDATRDWSFAGDVAEAMWLMLQQEAGNDYVVCSGVSRSVRNLVEAAFAVVGVDVDEHVVVDPEFVRPPDPVPLVGNPTEARERLGWEPRTGFDEMIGAMVDEDLRQLERAEPGALPPRWG